MLKINIKEYAVKSGSDTHLIFNNDTLNRYKKLEVDVAKKNMFVNKYILIVCSSPTSNHDRVSIEKDE